MNPLYIPFHGWRTTCRWIWWQNCCLDLFTVLSVKGSWLGLSRKLPHHFLPSSGPHVPVWTTPSWTFFLYRSKNIFSRWNNKNDEVENKRGVGLLPKIHHKYFLSPKTCLCFLHSCLMSTHSQIWMFNQQRLWSPCFLLSRIVLCQFGFFCPFFLILGRCWLCKSWWPRDIS